MLSLSLVIICQTVELIYGGGKDTEYFQKANSLLAQGDYRGAIEYYGKAIEVYPSFKEAYNNMGVTYTLVGDTASAMASFRKAISLDSLYVDPALNLASCYASLGKPDSAIKFYNIVLKLDPDNQKALSAFAAAQAQAINQSRQNPDTTTVAQGGKDGGKGGKDGGKGGKDGDKGGKEGKGGQSGKDGKGSKDGQSSAGAQHADSLNQAVTKLEGALVQDPYNPQYYYDLATLLDKAGRYEEALDYYYGFLNTSEGRTEFAAMRQFAEARLQELAKALRRK